MVSQLSSSFVFIKHTLEQQAYQNYSILEIERENMTQYKLPPGVKPIIVQKDTALIKKKSENGFYKIGLLKFKQQGVTATSVLEIGFSPKMVLNLDSIKDDSQDNFIMLVGQKSINDFAILKLSNNSMTLIKKSGLPVSLSKILKTEKSQMKQDYL